MLSGLGLGVQMPHCTPLGYDTEILHLAWLFLNQKCMMLQNIIDLPFKMFLKWFFAVVYSTAVQVAQALMWPSVPMEELVLTHPALHGAGNSMTSMTSRVMTLPIYQPLIAMPANLPAEPTPIAVLTPGPTMFVTWSLVEQLSFPIQTFTQQSFVNDLLNNENNERKCENYLINFWECTSNW